MILNKYCYSLENINTGKKRVITKVISLKEETKAYSDKGGRGEERLQTSRLKTVLTNKHINSFAGEISSMSPLGKAIMIHEQSRSNNDLLKYVSENGKSITYKIINKVLRKNI